MLLGVLAFILPVQNVSAQPTTITAYKSQYAVNVNSAYQPSQWTDTSTINVAAAGMTFAAKQNGTGWLFLMTWQQSKIYCTDEYCFGGIELGYLNNTQPMGGSTTPTVMIRQHLVQERRRRVRLDGHRNPRKRRVPELHHPVGLRAHPHKRPVHGRVLPPVQAHQRLTVRLPHAGGRIDD